MATWNDLDAELDAWHVAGHMATLWWRDDDAGELTPAAERLLDLAREWAFPLHAAVIPANVTDALARAIRRAPGVSVIQHGYAHVDHAPEGKGAWELGLHRPLAVMLDELRAGLDGLRAVLGDKVLPMLAPPWGRMDPALSPHLYALGFRAISMFRSRPAAFPAPGLLEISGHCDPIRWKAGLRFVGTEAAIGHVVHHLQARRTGRSDPDEPTGFVTHHLDMDEEAWAFTAELFRRTARRPPVCWLSLEHRMPA